MSRKKLLVIYPKKPGGEYVVTKNICQKLLETKRLKTFVREIEEYRFFLSQGRLRLLRSFLLNSLIFIKTLRKIPIQIGESLDYIYSPSPLLLFFAYLFPKFKRAKFIYQFHGFEYGEDDKSFWQYLKKGKMNLLVKYFYFLPLLRFYYFQVGVVIKKSWKIFVPTSYSILVILKKFPQIRKDKFIVIPNGYNPQIFYPQKKNFRSKTHKILYVGRLAKEKGIRELAWSFKLLDAKRFSLTLACSSSGDIEFEKEIKKAISKRKNINLLMNLSVERIADYYWNSDLCVLPSNVYFEQFPLVYLESLACGIPVLISKKIPGILSWQNHIAPNLILGKITPSEIASKIKEFFQISEKKKDEIRKRCLDFAKDYTWDNSVLLSKKLFSA